MCAADKRRITLHGVLWKLMLENIKRARFMEFKCSHIRMRIRLKEKMQAFGRKVYQRKDEWAKYGGCLPNVHPPSQQDTTVREC